MINQCYYKTYHNSSNVSNVAPMAPMRIPIIRLEAAEIRCGLEIEEDL